MPQTQIDKLMWETWAAFEALRRLGFSSDDIFFHPAAVDPVSKEEGMGVLLKAQGKQFAIFIGPHGLPPQQLGNQWQEFVSELQRRENDELARRWTESKMSKASVDFIKALLDKGFYIPKTRDA